MRIIATLIVVILACLPALFAGWPNSAPAAFGELFGGVPGSVVAMSLLILAFVVLAGVCGAIARGASAADEEAGR